MKIGKVDGPIKSGCLLGNIEGSIGSVPSYSQSPTRRQLFLAHSSPPPPAFTQYHSADPWWSPEFTVAWVRLLLSIFHTEFTSQLNVFLLDCYFLELATITITQLLPT